MNSGELAAERALVVVGPDGEVRSICASWAELSSRPLAPGESLEGVLCGLEDLGWKHLLAGRQPSMQGVCRVDVGDGSSRLVQVSAQAFAGGGGALVVLEPPLAVGPAGDPQQQLALDRIRDAIIVGDRDWRISFINRAAEAYFHRSRAEVLGRTVWEVFPELRGTRLEQEVRDSLARNRPVQLELVGPIRQRRVVVQTYPSPTGLSVYFHDVTEERAAAEAKRNTELRYQSLFENSLDGILLTLPSGEVLEANPEACRLLGRTAEEIRAVGRDGLFDPEDPRRNAFLAARAHERRTRAELSVVRKDGTRFDAEVSSALYRDTSGMERACVVFRALGEHRRAEQALRFMAEAGSVLAGSLDFERTLTTLASLLVPRLASLCFLDLLDGDEIDRVALSFREPFEAAAVQRLRQTFSGLLTSRGSEQVMHSGEPELVPVVDDAWLREATRDAASFQTVRALGIGSLLIVPLLERGLPQGRVLGALTLARGKNQPSFEAADLPLATGVADRAALAIHNARLYADALRAKALRDEMLGFVSHDLRNPLTTIKLNTEILQRRADNRQLQAIARAAGRADRLINDLLTTAMIDARALQLERHPEELHEILQEVEALHATLSDEAQLHFTTEVEPGLPSIDCDRHRLVQLLSNLVSNAFKFTAPGGRVALRAFRGPGQLLLTVEDDGSGIAREDLDHIFDRFWQGSHAKRAGAGLGLAICQGIASAHGWKLSVESERGQGTRFTLAMPLRPEAEQSAPPPGLT